MGDCQQLLHQWRAYEATEAALLPSTMKAAGGDGRSSGHPDPTGNLVATLTARGDRKPTELHPDGYMLIGDVNRYDESVLELTEAYGHLVAVYRRVSKVMQHHPDVAREAELAVRALRCDGELDPLCTANAVRAGKCWTHYRQHLDQQKSAECAPSTPERAITARLANGTPASAVVTCTLCAPVNGELARFDVPAGLDPQLWLTTHRMNEHGA